MVRITNLKKDKGEAIRLTIDLTTACNIVLCRICHCNKKNNITCSGNLHYALHQKQVKSNNTTF